MVVGDGKEKVPEGLEPLVGRGFGEPGVIQGLDLVKTWIGRRMNSLPFQLPVHQIVNLIEPLNQFGLAVNIDRKVFIIGCERGPTVLTG